MNTERILRTLTHVVLLVALAGLAQAQSNEDRARGLKLRSNDPGAAAERTRVQERRVATDDQTTGAGDRVEGTGLPDVIERAKAAQEKLLVGSYEATFTSVETPASFPPLPALFTFEQGGMFIETDGGALPGTPPPNQTFGSPGHGSWVRLGDGLFAVKFVIIVVNPDGTLAFKGAIKLTIRLSNDGKSFEGEGTFDFVDTEGNPLEGAFGREKVSGRKIEAE